MRATVCAAMLLIAVAACGWKAEGEEQLREGCQQLADAPYGSPGWDRARDEAEDAFHYAADLDDRWNTVAIAHDRLQRLPADTPPEEFRAELETWVGAVGAECEKVNISL
jgi:hypothetical protein